MAVETTHSISFEDVINKHNTSGLANGGATCYINTTIQCLGYCTEFLKFILVGPRAKSNTPLTNELRDIYVELWVKRNAIIPQRFLRSLQMTLGNYINIFEQNDITEFLLLYLDKLNNDLHIELLVDDEDFKKVKENAKKLFQEPMYADLASDMEIAWLKTIRKEYSPIMDLFYGQVVSQIICGNCRHIHHNYETYSNLSLSIKNDTNTLEDCLALHFTDETINNQEQEWKCDQCNVKAPSKKSLKLWKNPNILIVSLKRFNHQLVKKNILVKAPIELNLSKYTIHTPRVKYKLVAIANHQGSIGSGHYNCVCRHKSDKWFAIDDAMVREAQPNELDYSLNNGYVYFYECQEA